MSTATHERFHLDRREMRARQFANSVFHFLQRYIPEACREAALDELHAVAFERNLQVVEIPPEMDAMQWLELERQKYATRIPDILK